MLFVAEMSANHQGSKETALKICNAAERAGASAIKLQTYTPENMSLDPELRKLYKKAMTPREWHKDIFEHCKKIGILCFSTPFTIDDVDFLETLDCPMYKVASFELVDIPLIQHIASKGKPIIMSIGMATELEIIDALRAAGNCPVTLLKCTSAYPAEAKQANLATLADLKNKFKYIKVGISDHTPGIGVSVAAVALGAEVVEKHFTLEKKGVDAAVSLSPYEFSALVTECKRAKDAIGKVAYGSTQGELKDYRRSLWAIKEIKAGEQFTSDNVQSLRPAGGVESKHFPGVLGKKAKRDINKGEPLRWDCF